MMLGIGNKSFTLIEVMITTAVLSLGVLLIFEAFFVSLDAFDYYSNYLDITSWADEKIWQTQDSLSRLGPLAQIETNGTLVNKNKNYKWSLSHYPVGTAKNLYGMNLVISWEQGQRKARLLRSAYAMYNEE